LPSSISKMFRMRKIFWVLLAATVVEPDFSQAVNFRKDPVPEAAPSATATSPTPVSTQLPSSAIEGDKAFQDRKNSESAKRALELYRAAYKEEPKNPETGWRVAMACYFVGNRFVSDEKEKEKLFNEGQIAGKRASEINPKCAPCHFWTAITMALYGETVGVFKMIFSLDEIQNRLKKVIELEPTYAGSGAYRLLGTIQWKLPGVLGGSDSKAKANLEKAIETSPTETLNYLFLARLLRQEFEQPEQALAIAKKGLEVPLTKLDRLESFEAIEDLKKFVASQP
jgi:tetratricopeptide (TPR) repeat protein